MSMFYPTMSMDERQSVLFSDLDDDLQAGRWFGAACMAGALEVLGSDPTQHGDPSVWRSAAANELTWLDPGWLERAATLEADDDIRRLVLLLRVDEAGCGIGYLGVHAASVIAEMEAIVQLIDAEPAIWGRLGTAALRRMRELESSSLPNPAYRVWRAVFHAWRATAEVEQKQAA